jgi:prepilin-type N-terminal cleavage/methylation domain-containing protein
MPQSRAASRRGFTLLEVAIVMAASTLLLMICAVTTATAIRLTRSGLKTLDTMSQISDLADQFRWDVSRATAAPADFGRYKAGPACLLLRTGKDDDYVVYHWESGVLERIFMARVAPDRRRLAIPASVMPEFERSGPSEGIVTMRLVDSNRRAGRVIEIAAALGGQLR